MQIVDALKIYILKVLGIEVSIAHWSKEQTLPFFLRDQYSFLVLRLLGNDYLLMVDCQETSPAAIMKRMEQVREVWQGDVIYVRKQVSAYSRNRLVHNRIPFVVPNNQLYLPMLAIDLREYFMTKQTEIKKISPAAQVLVLRSIYKQRILFGDKRTMTQWANELGYTKMTMTRAFREIRTILEEEKSVEELSGKKFWDLVKPYLRNPIRLRKYYNTESLRGSRQVISGDNALAYYTNLAEPNGLTVCMNGSENRAFQQEFMPQELEHQEPECLCVEIWRYDPRLLAENGVADPLSLYLAYESNKDERVEMALEDLLEKIQW
jgi:hypothetical protein